MLVTVRLAVPRRAVPCCIDKRGGTKLENNAVQYSTKDAPIQMALAFGIGPQPVRHSRYPFYAPCGVYMFGECA